MDEEAVSVVDILGIRSVARDFGDIKWAEIKSGCLSNHVPGQLQTIGQDEER